MRVVYVVGARPNFIKLAPVLAELRRRRPDGRHVLVNTGQHYSHAMSELFLDELDMPAPDHSLGVGSGTHAQQTARVLERLEPILEHERPDVVLVPGDVNSTLAAALAAVKLRIPIGHIESGLRSFDRTMPEEINRIVADEFSDYLFLHSEEAIENLRREGIPDQRMHFVGNTMIDTLIAFEDRFRSLRAAESLGMKAGQYLLVTLHRPALVDGPLLKDVLARLDEVAAHLPVLFPVHPRTRKMIETQALPTGRLTLVDPLGYIEFLSLEADAAGVLTDSGGVQEETTFLRVPCFTLRDTTERPVTIRAGTNRMLGLDPAGIAEILPALSMRGSTGPLPEKWDGRASERIADVLEQSFPKQLARAV